MTRKPERLPGKLLLIVWRGLKAYPFGSQCSQRHDWILESPIRESWHRPKKSVAPPCDEESYSIARPGLASCYQIPEGQMDRAEGAMKFDGSGVAWHTQDPAVLSLGIERHKDAA